MRKENHRFPLRATEILATFATLKTIKIMTTYNIIGDIHGRQSWKELVDENCINIFLGDYFDPYEMIPFPELERNFLEIIDHKKAHPDNVILLYGNHDYRYLPKISELSSRYDSQNASRIRFLLVEAEPLFYGVAFAIGERYLVSHAGVSRPWQMKYLPEIEDFSPSKMEKAINKLWKLSKSTFGFKYNADYLDFYGESPCHSPIWIRPESLRRHNLYKQSDVIQVVGHSQFKAITETDGIVFVDCLGTVADSKRIVVE